MNLPGKCVYPSKLTELRPKSWPSSPKLPRKRVSAVSSGWSSTTHESAFTSLSSLFGGSATPTPHKKSHQKNNNKNLNFSNLCKKAALISYYLTRGTCGRWPWPPVGFPSCSWLKPSSRSCPWWWGDSGTQVRREDKAAGPALSWSPALPHDRSGTWAGISPENTATANTTESRNSRGA